MKTRQELAIIRAKCDKDLLFFTRFFYKELRGTKFIVNDHHHEICFFLNEVVNYQLELLNINIPPRMSKTELVLNLVARGIGMNPKANYLYITASDELRSEVSIRIRDIVTHQYFKIMYGVELKKDQNAKNLWRTEQGGGLKTATIFGQITGFGAGQMKINEDLQQYIRDFEGAIVIDDANKTDDSQIENANNDKVSRTFFNTILSRKNSKDTPIINIQQRAGLSDLTSQLEDHYRNNPKAKFLVMPIIKDGIPLWEWKHDLEDIEKLRTSPKTAHVFETQYMQNPQPSEGVVFHKKNTNSFKLSDLTRGNCESKIGSIDVADKGVDYFSFPSSELYGDMIYITEWIYTQRDMGFTIPKTTGHIRDVEMDHLVVETNNHGVHVYKEIKSNIGSYTNIKGVFQTTNKHSRIINVSEFIKKHFVFRTDYEIDSDYDKAMKHLFRYAKDGSFKIDDAPDSLALLALFYMDLFKDRFKY